jgi:polyphosphate kinase
MSMSTAGEISRVFLSVPAETPVAPVPPRLDDPSLFVNRELSWLEFNARVLAEAGDDRVPLYERLKFVAIFASNLDEFFMVRAAGLQAQLSGDVDEVPPDGMTADQQLTAVAKRAHELVDEQYKVWNRGLKKEIRAAGLALLTPDAIPRTSPPSTSISRRTCSRC